MDCKQTSPTLWLDCGGNPQSLRKTRDNAKWPTFIKVTAIKDLNPIYDWLNSGQPAEHAFVKKCKEFNIALPKEPFQSVVLDGVTELQRIRVSEIVGYSNAKPGDDIKRAEIQHWGDALSSVMLVARRFYDLPLTVVFTCLEKTEQDGEGGPITYTPWLWGQARNELPGYSLLTIRLCRFNRAPAKDRATVKGDAYNLAYFTETGRFLAKDQYSTGLQIVANPTFEQVLAKL